MIRGKQPSKRDNNKRKLLGTLETGKITCNKESKAKPQLIMILLDSHQIEERMTKMKKIKAEMGFLI